MCSAASSPSQPKEEEQKLTGGGRGRSPWDHTYRKAMIEAGGSQTKSIEKVKEAP